MILRLATEQQSPQPETWRSSRLRSKARPQSTTKTRRITAHIRVRPPDFFSHPIAGSENRTSDVFRHECKDHLDRIIARMYDSTAFQPSGRKADCGKNNSPRAGRVSRARGSGRVVNAHSDAVKL